MPKITKRFVDTLKLPTAGETFHWDEGLKGFGVRIKASGAASFICQYRTKHGQTRRMTLAGIGEKTPEEARTLARKTLGAAAEGRDPSAERKASRKAKTFAELAEAYQASPGWERKSAGSQVIDGGRIKRHLLPLIGKRVVETLRRSDMEKLFRDIRDGKTATTPDTPSGKARGRVRVKGGEGAARRTLALASAILSYGVREGVITSNPCIGVDTGRDGSREAIVEDVKAYGKLFRASADLENEGAPAAAINAIRLIALLGCRRGEITGLRWRSVDLANSRLVLEPHEHKTGHRTGKPKVIVLPAAAVAIIAGLPKADDGDDDDLVIQSAKDGARIDLKKAWAKVRERAELPANLTLHGLRHSIASHLAMNGASAAEIQAAMGHANIATSVKYVHFAEARKNALAERAAAVAVAGLYGASMQGEPRPAGNVVRGPFHGTA